MNNNAAKQSQNSAIKSRVGAEKLRSALGQGIIGQIKVGTNAATSSNYSGGPSKKGNFVPTKKNVPRFMTKKEKEAKEAQDKKQKAFRERLKRMKELEKEILEM